MKNALFLLLLWCSFAIAQPLEIISLRHRTAAQMLPVLQPFVEAGGALTGVNDKLFLRASARNQAEIRTLLKELDTPLRRLMISLRQAGEGESDAAGAGVRGTVRIENGKVDAGGTARVYSSDRRQTRSINQQVQTLDGSRASIMVGTSFLIPLRQMVLTPAGAVVSDVLVERDIGSGFYALPRLSDNHVTIEISPFDDTISGGSAGQGDGVVQRARLVTTVSGRLGEWIELGGATSSDSATGSGTVHYSTRSASRQRRLLLKVDEIP
jgi:type II secretory pathway component GspD/PulD (secretin)